MAVSDCGPGQTWNEELQQCVNSEVPTEDSPGLDWTFDPFTLDDLTHSSGALGASEYDISRWGPN